MQLNFIISTREPPSTQSACLAPHRGRPCVPERERVCPSVLGCACPLCVLRTPVRVLRACAELFACVYCAPRVRIRFSLIASVRARRRLHVSLLLRRLHCSVVTPLALLAITVCAAGCAPLLVVLVLLDSPRHVQPRHSETVARAALCSRSSFSG